MAWRVRLKNPLACNFIVHVFRGRRVSKIPNKAVFWSLSSICSYIHHHRDIFSTVVNFWIHWFAMISSYLFGNCSHSGFNHFSIPLPPQHSPLVPNYYWNIPLQHLKKEKPKILIFSLVIFQFTHFILCSSPFCC